MLQRPEYRTNCAWNVYSAKWDVYNKGEVYLVLFDLFCSDKGLYILKFSLIKQLRTTSSEAERPLPVL